MINKYGYFGQSLGGYTITKLPKVGLYEYIYKNDELLLKLDQFGLQTAQINPPVGEALIKREKREIGSPATLYFDFGKGVFHTFDVFQADELRIDFTPEKAVYSLRFGSLWAKTEVFVVAKGQRFVCKTTFENEGKEELCLRVMPCVYPYVNALLMAPWDKSEWYTKTEYKQGKYPVFQTTRYSVSGNKAERRYFTCVYDGAVNSYELSSERLVAQTNNFTSIPQRFCSATESVLYAFEQCFAAVSELSLSAGETKSVTLCFACENSEENVQSSIEQSILYLQAQTQEREMQILSQKYAELFSKREIQTADADFNRFINGFLPLELDWVSALDRGWPTGMRGVRDASNDFQGFLAYDKALCRSVVANIFSKQRSDGWYPRQVPFGDSDKFDLRHFVDSACFFTEFVYDYLAFTDDYSILDEHFPYYDLDKTESGLAHLIAGVEYLMKPEHIGEHGLVKMQGGDWLDCLSSAGIKGRGETVMVSCQLIMSIAYLTEILAKKGEKVDEKYAQFAAELKQAINQSSFNSEGFYSGVFTDEGEWIFSVKDPDGERRVYAPTNAYAVISGVAEGKEQSVLNHVKGLRGDDGYKLFSTPFGVKPIRGIGKMGTGDFQPYFAENGSVYNHGSQCFVLRALAKVGDYQAFEDVLNYALPLDENRHAPDSLCGAPYAITNCYHLVPSFKGRTGFSFLTGSVAMIARAVYSWMFGIRFTLNKVEIAPCLPERYGNASVQFSYGKTRVAVTYKGYGARVRSAMLDGKSVCTQNGIMIDKDYFANKEKVNITVCMENE